MDQKSQSTRSRAADVTREVIGGRLLALVDEMAIVLARSSMSPVIYEVLDLACGLCDAEGSLLAQTNGITLFTGTFTSQVRFIKSRFSGAMAPSDTFLTNDPYQGGTHACDFAVVRPVFHEGEVIAFAIAVAHLLDVGGAQPGSLPPDASSVFQEGLRLSGVRLTRGDRLLDDLERVIIENVRFLRWFSAISTPYLPPSASQKGAWSRRWSVMGGRRPSPSSTTSCAPAKRKRVR